MKTELSNALLACETDVEGAIQRFSGNESLYLSLLDAFIEENTMDKLNFAIDACDWDEAFMQAHALKGLAGNMGFVPLFHAVGELILVIRTGKINEVDIVQHQITGCYNSIIAAIKHNINAEEKKNEPKS